MVDREKVIKAVECRRNVHKRCGNPCERIGNCEYAVWARDSDSEPYYPYCCDIERLCNDILLLLKKQKTVRNTISKKQMDAWLKDRQQDEWTNRVHEMGE